MKKNYKLIYSSSVNSDQTLLGFYETFNDAANDKPQVCRKNSQWISDPWRVSVKHVHPEMICKPVGTDYDHYLRSLIPDDEYDRVVASAAGAEISCNNMTCDTERYYMLSKMIWRDWTVIDFGCGYNAQSYFFAGHRKHIAVDPPFNDSSFQFERFQAAGTDFYEMTGQQFIYSILPELDLGKTFAICHFVPDDKCQRLVRDTFENMFVLYP